MTDHTGLFVQFLFLLYKKYPLFLIIFDKVQNPTRVRVALGSISPVSEAKSAYHSGRRHKRLSLSLQNLPGQEILETPRISYAYSTHGQSSSFSPCRNGHFNWEQIPYFQKHVMPESECQNKCATKTLPDIRNYVRIVFQGGDPFFSKSLFQRDSNPSTCWLPLNKRGSPKNSQ